MFGYKVEINSICTESYRSEEEWGSWSSQYSNYFEDVTKTDTYPDITSSLDIKEGELCFVVWAEWSSGDSFGHGVNSNTEALAIFKDPESAKMFKKEVESITEYSRESFVTPDGQEHDIYCPWTGYFEELTEIHIEQTILKYSIN